MAENKSPKVKKDHPHNGNTKVRLIKSCIGAYRIADPVGTTRTVSADLAKKMIESKHAVEA
tara:strand:+ start:498 stop:680 length:183 start_codon:yes stop_codon:yes gene_type:complete